LFVLEGIITIIMTWEMVSYSYKTNSYISFVPVKIFEWMFNVDVIDFELKKEPM